MIKIREAQLPPAYKDYIDNWSTYIENRTAEEKLYWDSVWETIEKAFICNMPGGYELYSVDGGQIRTKIDLDFCLGGSWCRYPWVKDGALVIEQIMPPGFDRNAVIIHEYTEVTEGLLLGVPYERAHNEYANREESRYRMDPKSSKYYAMLLDVELEK